MCENIREWDFSIQSMERGHETYKERVFLTTTKKIKFDVMLRKLTIKFEYME